MNEIREYKILLEVVSSHNGCVSQMWICGIKHNRLINGIQNGGMNYFDGPRQKILDFKMMIR